ncbi:MAG: D-alanyl-D-alanine carboxypeptidase [Coriobacteriales bacterium]|nr:D-alanyl-D-alanine carboxypeptidase [Coriobacteriales bacterium]
MKASIKTRRQAFIACILCTCLAICVGMFGPQSKQAYAEDWSVYGRYDMPSISCGEAMVMMLDGTSLFERDADYEMPMASITKIMTALVTLESGIPLNTVVTISQNAAGTDGSAMNFYAGEQLTLIDLLYGLLIHSGNDAAVAIAEAVGGSEEAFVVRMNATAAALGLDSTHFSNPHGLDASGHYSTARDLLNLARYCWQYDVFKTIVGTQHADIFSGGSVRTFYSTDDLLNNYPGMRGVKTGYTYGAGNAFLGCATRGGVTLFTVVLFAETTPDRFNDTQAMLDWAYNHFPERDICLGNVTVFGYAAAPFRFGLWYPVTSRYDAISRTPLGTSNYDSLKVITSSNSLATPGELYGCAIWSNSDGVLATRGLYTDGKPRQLSSFNPYLQAIIQS